MKKIAAAITTLVLALFGSVATVSPASAQWNDFNGTTQYITTGQSVSWDWNLCGADASNNWFVEGSLPPGLTFAPSGALTGIATAPGTYYVGNFHCSIYIPGYGEIVNAGSNSGGITIVVSQNASPAPSVVLTNISNSLCEFQITGTVPATPNPGSVVLALSNGTSTGNYTLANVAAATPFHITASLQDLSTMFNNSAVASVDTAPALSCGDSITATLSYSTAYDAVASAASTVSVSLPVPPVLVSVVNLNDALCDIRVVATVAATPDAGSLKLKLTDGTNTLTATIADHQAGELIDITIPTKPFSTSQISDIVSTTTQNEYEPACGRALTATLTYDHSGAQTVSQPTASVIPTQGIVGTPTVSVTPIGGPTCLVAVTAYIPMSSVNTSLWVGNFEGTGVKGFQLTSYPTNRPFSVLIPMNDIGSTRSNYITGDPADLGSFTCGGPVSAMVSLASLDETLANFDNVAHSEFAPYETSSVTCGLGTFKTIAGICAPAERGYFVNLLNATQPTACPVGYNTFGIGATSPSDCYKVLLQTIKGLTAPKALKYKASALLPITTTAGVAAQVGVSGPCTISTVPAGGRANGKKVKVATLVVKAGTTDGNCVLTYASQEVQTYGSYNKTLTIKVNKKGK